jgi:hypothetical protein
MDSVFTPDYFNYNEIHEKIVSPSTVQSTGLRKMTLSYNIPSVSDGNNGDIWITV